LNDPNILLFWNEANTVLEWGYYISFRNWGCCHICSEMFVHVVLCSTAC